MPRLEIPPIPIEFDMITPQARQLAANWQKLPKGVQDFAPAALGVLGVRLRSTDGDFAVTSCRWPSVCDAHWPQDPNW